MSARRHRNKAVTDFEAARLFLLFENEIYRVLKNTPKEYNFDLKQQMKDSLGFMKRTFAKSLKLIPYDNHTWEAKRDMMNDAYSECGVVMMILGQLNDLGAISDKTKARLDVSLAELEINFANLLSTFAKKTGKSVNGSDVEGCAPCGEPEDNKDA